MVNPTILNRDDWGILDFYTPQKLSWQGWQRPAIRYSSLLTWSLKESSKISSKHLAHRIVSIASIRGMPPKRALIPLRAFSISGGLGLALGFHFLLWRWWILHILLIPSLKAHTLTDKIHVLIEFFVRACSMADIALVMLDSKFINVLFFYFSVVGGGCSCRRVGR